MWSASLCHHLLHFCWFPVLCHAYSQVSVKHSVEIPYFLNQFVRGLLASCTHLGSELFEGKSYSKVCAIELGLSRARALHFQLEESVSLFLIGELRPPSLRSRDGACAHSTVGLVCKLCKCTYTCCVVRG